MKDGKLDLPWQSLAQPQQTIVVYMGLHSLEEFTAKITQAGLSEQTPIAIIERGTTPEQRVLTSTLKDVSKKVTEVDIESPALAIVGEVVGLRARYAWFETVHK